jgi:hypothetical protein
MADDKPKARLETILGELEHLLPLVKDVMTSFRKCRDVATGDGLPLEDGDFSFVVIIDGESIPLEAPSESSTAIREAARVLMATRGEEVSKLWVRNIAPLVDEAVTICGNAKNASEGE